MPEPEMEFCGLCGKNKPASDFDKIPLSQIGERVFMYSVCGLCRTVIHNIRRIVSDAENEERERLKGIVEKVEKGRIIIPYMNFRS
jgi:hypothetical protein